jgi:glycosyltransferase involved in cell wall biosynthesis
VSLKVLVISNYTGPVNSYRPEAEMYMRMAQKGVQVTVMTPGPGDYHEKFENAGIKVIDFEPKKKVDREAIDFIRKELIKSQYDILHLFNNKAIANGNKAAKGLPVKVLTYRGYTGNIYWWDPSCYLTHLNPRVDKIVCLADSVKEWMEKHTMARKDKTVVINKGHHPSWFEDIAPAGLKQFGIPENAIVFGTIANIRRMKGLPYLLKATYMIDPSLPVHFLLVGDKMEKPEFKKLIEKSPLKDRIHLTGFRKDAIQLMAACDATLLASIKGEATPKAVIESMYLGITPILTNITGNRNMVEDGKSGFIVPLKNAEAIARAVEKVARLSPEERTQIGNNARERALKIFNIDDSVENYLKLYKELTGKTEV